MIHFDTDEVVIKEIRGPRASVMLRILIVAVLAILPLFVINLYPHLSLSSLTINGSSRAFFIFCYALWLLVIWVDFFIWWMRYCLRTIVLTDSRIFDLTKKKLWSRDVTSVRLEDIEDITIGYKGKLSAFSQVGKLTIITKSNGTTHQEITFPNTFEPEAVKKMIIEAQRVRREKIATVSYAPQIVQQ